MHLISDGRWGFLREKVQGLLRIPSASVDFRAKNAKFPIQIKVIGRTMVAVVRCFLGLVGVSPLELKAGLSVMPFKRGPLTTFATWKR